MSSIVILGAGELGGALARRLAAGDTVRKIALVDESANVAAGKALDIRQAAPVDRYGTSVEGATDIAAVIGAQVVVLADRAATGVEWQDEAALGLIASVLRLNSSAPIVCAGARHDTVLERCVRELGIPRSRMLGSAPEALRAAVIAMTALEAHCSPAEISLTVVGRPANHIIVPWEDASIAGRRATSVLSPPAITRLDGRLPKLWPPGPLTLASAASAIIETALERGSRSFAAFVAVSRDEGQLGRVGMLSISVNDKGVDAVLATQLSTRDRVRLETALYS